jgi:membrane protease YdiL (CAAX protease family)
MELETASPQPPSKFQFALFNDRGLRAGWRLLIFVGMFVTLLQLAALGVSHLRGAQSRAPLSAIPSPVELLLGEMSLFLVFLFFTWIMSRIERRPMGTYGLPLRKQIFPRFFAGYTLWGFLPLTLLLLVMRGLGVFYFGKVGLHGADILRYAVVWFAVFLFVGLLEEYMTRGYALYTLADGIGFWPASILMALIFGFLHLPNPGETRIGILDVCLFAMFAAVTLRRTGDLWLAVGAHAGWDWGQSFFYGVNDSGTQAVGHLFNSQVQGPGWLSGGSVGPEGSVLSSVLLVGMTAAFLVFYRNHRDPGDRAKPDLEPPSLVQGEGN